MFKTLKTAFGLPDLRKKILYTLFILFLFRLGSQIFVPYVDSAKMNMLFEANAGGTILGYMNMLSGQAFSQATLFALSVSPYITASIVIQLLTIAIPALHYFIDENGIHQKTTIRNDSDLNMPCAIGFHTTFNVLFMEGQKLGDTTVKLSCGREAERTPEYLPTGKYIEDTPLQKALNNDGFTLSNDGVAHLYEMTEPRQMILTDKNSGHSVTYTASDGYLYWMFYQLPGSEFICAEPQTWISNCPCAPFNREETGFRYLEPNAEMTVETVISCN